MPPDSLTLAVTSGIGISIIAGLLSGVCYVLVHGFGKDRPRSYRDQWHCTVCGSKFRSIDGVLESERVATCARCGGKVCKTKCSNRDPNIGWICQSCRRPESWFKGILRALRPNPNANTSGTKMDPNSIDELDEDLEELKRNEKEQVRDFIERLVEAMLGGDIDNTSITRIYNDETYLPIIGQSPCSAHASLKLLIQRIIQEAIGLPQLKKVQEHPAAPNEDINRTYEDLLATAILNKVIQNYQDELPNSSANSASSRLSNSSQRNDKEYFLGKETLDSKWKIGNGVAADVDSTSISSLEEWVRSDSSIGSAKYVDHMSLTIQQRIEEASSSEDEPIQKETRRKDGQNWQENWVMQKRKFGGTASPIPVPMLVPNPTSEAKVLIGDRDAEDTTDLSDAGSEYGDTEPVHGIEAILVDSKTVIGGKNLLTNVNVDNDDVISQDGSTDTSDIIQEKERVFEQFSSSNCNKDDFEISETFNITLNSETESNEGNSPASLESHTEQDTEYTEKYATLPRTIMKSPPIESRDLKNVTESFIQSNGESDKPRDGVKEEKQCGPIQNGYHKPIAESHVEDEFEQKFIGSYSEREKQKWQNAVEMKNNPYSTENLNRRLSTRSSDGSIATGFGRDYYIKEAARSAGARKKLNANEDEAGHENMQPTPLLFKAVPAIIKSADTNLAETAIESPIQIASPTPSNVVEVSSDSDLSVERIYNLTSGKIYETLGNNNNREIIEASKIPDGIKCASSKSEIDAPFAGPVDENHNSMKINGKLDYFKSITETNGVDHQSNDDTFNSSEYTSLTFDNFDTQHNSTYIAETETTIGRISPALSNNDSLSNCQEFSLEYSMDGYEEQSSSKESSLNPDPEIVDLKDKHLVKNRLGQLSKSYPNLAAVPSRRKSFKKEDALNRESVQSIEEVDSEQAKETDVTVEDLRKKFDKEIELLKTKEDLSKKQVYSLTARSIPREFRQELKGTESAAEQDESHNTSIATTEDTNKEELKIFPDAKSRIRFFENLRP